MTSITNDNLLGLTGMENTAEAGAKSAAAKKAKAEVELPANLGKAWNDCEVPDFNDPNRPKTCLEVDFPIAQINALSQLEGNAGKPIYQMSKWWARRRSICHDCGSHWFGRHSRAG